MSFIKDKYIDIYFEEQPPEFTIAGHHIVLSIENLIKIFIVLAILIAIPALIAFFILNKNIKNNKESWCEL